MLLSVVHYLLHSYYIEILVSFVDALVDACLENKNQPSCCFQTQFLLNYIKTT